MDEKKLEFYQKLFTKSQLKRMKVVNEYLYTYGDLIKTKKISPNRALEILSTKYELSRAGVRFMLETAGVYKGKNNPVYYPTAEEKAAKPTYFFV